MSKTTEDVMTKEQEVKRVDLRFTDLPGQWQHLSILAQLRRAMDRRGRCETLGAGS
jgi:glutamine synthetase